MEFTLNIKMDNAAFGNDDGEGLAQGSEVARILRSLASVVEDMDDLADFERRLMDVNGNRVGKAEVLED